MYSKQFITILNPSDHRIICILYPLPYRTMGNKTKIWYFSEKSMLLFIVKTFSLFSLSVAISLSLSLPTLYEIVVLKTNF